MKYIAYIHNKILDIDFFWWPFSFLKPSPHEIMSWKLVTQMSLCFGLLIWFFIGIYSIMQGGININFLIMNLIISVASFFVWFALITKPLWNYRAKRLDR